MHSMGTMFIDDLDLYTWKDVIRDPVELMLQAQREVSQWSLLLNATEGALKPKKCFGYLLDYTCKEREWEYTVHSDFELYVNNPDGSKSSIKQEKIQTPKKTLGIYDSPAGATRAIWNTSTASSRSGSTECTTATFHPTWHGLLINSNYGLDYDTGWAQ
jgi:hypothetical protein